MWVLVPHLETEDPNLKYYYDFSQSYQEYTRVFTELKMDWAWQPVSMDSITETIHAIKNQASELKPLVINLCDGDEVNGCPGVSVIDELEKNEIPYTGSNRYFYEITTSKIPMKKAFDEAGVPTAEWGIIDGSTESCVELCNKIEPPLIIKPAISGGSMGVAVKNVVKSREQLLHRVEELNQGYRGWQLTTGGLFAEKFIEGPEFTTLIVGDASDPHNCFVFEPVERVFHESLPETEKFLSFDRLWEIYEDETPMPNNENFYSYRAVSNDQLREELKRISLQAYCAVSGKGYGRLDIRMDRNTGLLYLLEVNAQCGLSEDEDYTSIGAILRVSGRSFTELVAAIIGEGIGKRIM
jgi:D-alanine-D-alanine ligase